MVGMLADRGIDVGGLAGAGLGSEPVDQGSQSLIAVGSGNGSHAHATKGRD